MINRDLLEKGFVSGVRKGWSGFLWVLKILVPVSFLTAILEWSRLLHRLDFLIQPVMDWLHLPAMAALPLLIGVIGGIYGGIASMAVLPFSREEMTLIAIFMLIAHNLIQEGIIQGKSGLHPLKATFSRLAAATITVLLVAPFLSSGSATSAPTAVPLLVSQPFVSMLKSWSSSTLLLTMKIFVIIMGILILLEILKAAGWIESFVRMLAPLLKFLGLSQRVGVLWMAGAIFGLAYGAVVIIEEAREGHLTKEELEGLHLSIGINHSVIEDPLFFLAMGLNAFWLWIPRLIMAILAVRLLSLWQRGTRRVFRTESPRD
jgi:hypothetical protein